MAWLAEGAEARLEEEDFGGVPALRKTRPPKAYRAPELDVRLRTERLRTEVRLLREARRAGVRSPIVLDLDQRTMSLVLERLPGITLTELLDKTSPGDPEREAAVDRWGEALGRLHHAQVAHGDLTASNVLWDGQRVALLDLSLGSRTPGLEELGVDLHLVREDLNTLCSDRSELFERFTAAYRQAFPAGAGTALARAEEIQGRIRYG